MQAQLMKTTGFHDAIIFYFWLPEEELSNNIFTGIHKWWFICGMGYKTCIFYGPTITKHKHESHGPFKQVSISSKEVSWESLKKYLQHEGIANNPIISIVVERGILPNPESVKESGLQVQCIIADTHHTTNPITSAINFLYRVNPAYLSVSHSAHRRIFSDCLGIPAHPLVYSPINGHSQNQREQEQPKASITYYGNIADPYHPERTDIIKYLKNSRASRKLGFRPRLPPLEWQTSIGRDLASFTCSLNGFPSVQTFIPLCQGTCLITDRLSNKDDVARHLINGENCLVYETPEEAVEIIEEVSKDPEKAIEIGRNGKLLIEEMLDSTARQLMTYLHNLQNRGDKLNRLGPSGSLIPDKTAITASFIYELAQEMHRLSRKVYVSIRGTDRLSEMTSSYLEILPRVVIEDKDRITRWPSLEEQADCEVLISKHPLAANSKSPQQRCILLSTINAFQHEQHTIKQARSYNIHSIFKPCYEGVVFEQVLPGNIQLSVIE